MMDFTFLDVDNSSWGDCFDPFGFLQEITSSETKTNWDSEYLLSLKNEHVHIKTKPLLKGTVDDSYQITIGKKEESKTQQVKSLVQETNDNSNNCGLSYQMNWCLKTGKKKSQQFWTYCEESQNNFARFILSVPNMKLNANSCVMEHNDGYLCIVEDCTLDIVKILPVNDTNCFPNTILDCPIDKLNDLNQRDIDIDVKLVKDEEEPIHPFQGSPNIVHCNINEVTRNYREKLRFPIDFMFQINFTGRSEGWFKMLCTVSYKGDVLAETYSRTFMLNNPRMKKLKEHKLFSPEELKFMQIYSLERDVKENAYWDSLCVEKNLNLVKLQEKASILFPLCSKKRKQQKKLPNPKRRKLSNSE